MIGERKGYRCVGRVLRLPIHVLIGVIVFVVVRVATSRPGAPGVVAIPIGVLPFVPFRLVPWLLRAIASSVTRETTFGTLSPLSLGGGSLCVAGLVALLVPGVDVTLTRGVGLPSPVLVGPVLLRG